MNIEMGYNPTPSDHYFISVELNKQEWISFDNTTKGFRVIKQVLVDKKFDPFDEVSGEYNEIVLEDGKFIRMNHVVWQDHDRFDVVNGEVWETVWEKSIPSEVNEKLLVFSRFVADHLDNLNDCQAQLADFDSFVSEIVFRYQ